MAIYLFMRYSLCYNGHSKNNLIEIGLWIINRLLKKDLLTGLVRYLYWCGFNTISSIPWCFKIMYLFHFVSLQRFVQAQFVMALEYFANIKTVKSQTLQ